MTNQLAKLRGVEATEPHGGSLTGAQGLHRLALVVLIPGVVRCQSNPSPLVR